MKEEPQPDFAIMRSAVWWDMFRDKLKQRVEPVMGHNAILEDMLKRIEKETNGHLSLDSVIIGFNEKEMDHLFDFINRELGKWDQ